MKVLKKSTNESIGEILEKTELAVKLAPDLYNVLNDQNKVSQLFNSAPGAFLFDEEEANKSAIFGLPSDRQEIDRGGSIAVKKEMSLKNIRGVKQIKDIS